MKGRQIAWTKAELAWIETRAAMSRADLHKAFVEAFGRTDIGVDNIKALCTRRGWKTGRDGRFETGLEPHNKGKPMPYNANSAATRFRKGQLPHNTKYLGHERLSKDGYVEISIAQKNPHTGYERRYVLKHKHLWEQMHGPVPAGFCLKCVDSNRQNTDPANWELIERALLPRLGGRFGRNYDAAPPELKPTILAVSRVQQALQTLHKPKRTPGRIGRPRKNADA